MAPILPRSFVDVNGDQLALRGEYLVAIVAVLAQEPVQRAIRQHLGPELASRAEEVRKLAAPTAQRLVDERGSRDFRAERGGVHCGQFVTTVEAAARFGVTPRQVCSLASRLGGRRERPGGPWLLDPLLVDIEEAARRAKEA
jgi:hypothetical protein